MGLPHLIFRVDAGKIPGLSFGHLYRCLALERELRDFFLCTFLMADYPDGVAVARKAGVHVLPLPAYISDNSILQECNNAAVVVFDLPFSSSQLIDTLTSSGIATIVLDDTGNKQLSPTMLINGSLSEEQRRYPKNALPQQWLLGPQYCVLGEEFDATREYAVSDNPSLLTIFMGGSDPAGMTLKTINALISGNCCLSLTVALGSGFGNAAMVEKVLAKYGGLHKIVNSPASVVNLLIGTDLAVLAGGRTAYEAAALGVPAILLPSIEHESETASALEKAGIHRCIHGAWRLAQEELNKDLDKELVALMGHPNLLKQMSMRGRNLFDGGGRQRVAEAILSVLALPFAYKKRG